ncbi:virulence-associated E family protein [Dysosmobacter sp.]|uniref:virulence-associated E family protein n=1 Tax=Dysosmobacter sp. TaxID=2591382 RepID=UPI002AA038E7|nr:virulence-associated E family protein [Dysosmobacter sp.]MDY5509507.1 virulence-associated E family protein [Dysosmobacter sp.]
MKIATARQKTSKRWRTQEITWEQLLDRLRKPLYTGETVREYKAMSKEDRDRAKEAAGGFVGGALSCGQRKTEFVTERSLLTLDADHGKKGAWKRVTAILDFKMAVYSTHSHTEDAPRLRWIIPTDRPMTPDEYPAVARRVAEWLGIETMDPTTYEVARLMYWPTCSSDGTYVFRSQEGPVLRVRDVLDTYGCGDAWRDSTLWPISRTENEIRLRSMRKAGEPTEKPGMVGLFCRTFDVPSAIDAFLQDVYLPTDKPDRYTFARGSTSAGAILYNDGAFLFSNHATDPCGGQSVNAFDLVRIHKFGDLDADTAADTPVTKRPSYAAMCRWAVTLPEIKHQLVEERRASADADFGDMQGQGSEAPAAESGGKADEDRDWESRLELNHKTGECEPTVNNALLILLHDPALKGTFGYDLFAEKPRLRGDVPWRPKGSVRADTGRGTEWTDQDEAGLRWYLQLRWKYKSEKDLQNALELAMRANGFHPVQEYLRGLTWDGVPRLETLFVDYLGAEDTHLTRTITRKWFSAAVARVMRPGCKFDNCLVLCGPQNLGKSSFADVMSRGWFQDSLVDMNGKDGYEALHGSWIIELAELASTKRSDVETVKTFLSKREDTYRPAYARRAATFPRQCVFFGTTNEAEWLKDRTGNRRFWPITVTRRMDRAALERVADQVWAEAKVCWEKGETLWLDDPELEAELRETQGGSMVQDELEGLLGEYLDTPLPDNWDDLSPEARRDYIQGDLPGVDPSACTRLRDQVCITEIRVELLSEDRRKFGGSDLTSRRLANLMNNLPGWEKERRKRRLPGYGPQWCYVRTP